MKTAVYPGTFDPITLGHLDIVERASKLFDKIVVSVSTNPQKNPMFSLEERIHMVQLSTKAFSNVEVHSFEGLLVNYAEKTRAVAVIRGLRAVSDFEYEFQMALMNRKLNCKLETVFLMPSEKYTYINSTIVKEVGRLGGDVSHFLSEEVLFELNKKLNLL